MMRLFPLSHPQVRRGSVLIVVLWASVGLVSISLLFGHSMMMNYRGSDNDLAGRQAEEAIEGAIRYVQTLLKNEETPGTLPDPTTYEAEALTVGEATFWLLGRPADEGNGTTREYGLVDEASKLNLNGPTIAQSSLQYLPGMTPEIAEQIADWSDPNGTGSGSGGITATTVKHGPFESVEELALISGMTREILYGEDGNLNGVLDTSEDDGDHSLPADNSDGKLDPGLFEYVTAFTKEPNTQPGGGDEPIERLNVSQLGSPGAIAATMTIIDTVLPGHAQLTILPAAYPSVVEFMAKSGVSPALSDEELDKIAPYLISGDTTKTQAQTPPPIFAGLVNINTASQPVLASILGEVVAETIISERISRGSTTTGIAWAVPLLIPPGQPSLVTPATNLALLTGQSYQVSADIAAVGRHGRGYRRTRVVIDMSDPEKGPQVIYRRNLAPTGWALGRDVRENLALKKEVR